VLRVVRKERRVVPRVILRQGRRTALVRGREMSGRDMLGVVSRHKRVCFGGDAVAMGWRGGVGEQRSCQSGTAGVVVVARRRQVFAGRSSSLRCLRTRMTSSYGNYCPQRESHPTLSIAKGSKRARVFVKLSNCLKSPSHPDRW
jgi:hypothetical protein